DDTASEGKKGASVVVNNEAPVVPTYYANNTGVETSIWDVCLKFAETIETDKDNNITTVRELAKVRISPQHARVIVGILTKHLENYERDFGTIPRSGGGIHRNGEESKPH
ncbi:MAG TPA: DUF3467 domain-containing protein, partial [Candidatus Koribacter sp.]